MRFKTGKLIVVIILSGWLWPIIALAQTTIEASPLQTFVEQIWQSNPKIQAATAEVMAAEFRAKAQQQPLYNPNIEVEGNRTDTKNYSVGVSQTLDFSGKRHARTQVGSAELAIAKAQLQAIRLQLGAEALAALARYNTAVQTVQLAQQRTQLLRQFVQQITRKYQAGDTAKIQLDEAYRALAEAIAQEANTELTLSQAQQDLQTKTGVLRKHFPILPGALPQPPALTQPPVLIAQLPALQLLNQQVAKAKAAILVAKSEAHPDPTVSLQGGREEENKMVGVSISMPLFVRNTYQADIEQSNQTLTAIEQTRQDVYLHLQANLLGTANRYQITHTAFQAWQTTSSKSLKDSNMLLNRLWEAGELSTTDYLIQLKQLIDSQIAGRELQGEAWQAWFAWLEASGTLANWLKASDPLSAKGT